MPIQSNRYAGSMIPSNSMQTMEEPKMERMCQNAYPEIYYKLQPFIMVACD